MKQSILIPISAWLYVVAISPALADESVCGSAPALSSVANSAESIKGQLQGQADFLSKLVGKAELGGQVEAARNSIYQTSNAFLAAQKDAYLAYMFCVIVMQDKTLATSEKLTAINKFKSSTSITPSIEPKLEIVEQTEWQPDGDEVRRLYLVKLINPGAASKIHITAYGDDLLGIGFLGTGFMGTGEARSGTGWVSHELLTPASIRGFLIQAKKPTAIRNLEYSFQ